MNSQEKLEILSKEEDVSSLSQLEKLSNLHPVVERIGLPIHLDGIHYYLKTNSEKYGKEKGWISDSLLKRINCQ